MVLSEVVRGARGDYGAFLRMLRNSEVTIGCFVDLLVDIKMSFTKNLVLAWSAMVVLFYCTIESCLLTLLHGKHVPAMLHGNYVPALTLVFFAAFAASPPPSTVMIRAGSSPAVLIFCATAPIGTPIDSNRRYCSYDDEWRMFKARR